MQHTKHIIYQNTFIHYSVYGKGKPLMLVHGFAEESSVFNEQINYLKDNFSNVKFFTSHTAIDLLTALHHGVTIQQRYEENKVLGAYIFNQESKQV